MKDEVTLQDIEEFRALRDAIAEYAVRTDEIVTMLANAKTVADLDLAYDLARVITSALAHDLYHAFDRARYLDHAFARALNRTLDHALDLAVGLDLTLARARDSARETAQAWHDLLSRSNILLSDVERWYQESQAAAQDTPLLDAQAERIERSVRWFHLSVRLSRDPDADEIVVDFEMGAEERAGSRSRLFWWTLYNMVAALYLGLKRRVGRRFGALGRGAKRLARHRYSKALAYAVPLSLASAIPEFVQDVRQVGSVFPDVLYGVGGISLALLICHWSIVHIIQAVTDGSEQSTEK